MIVDPNGSPRSPLALLAIALVLALAGAAYPGSVAEAQSSRPTVETIVFRGLADGDSTYYRGEVVRVRVRFNQHVVVDVSGGAPHVDLLVGSETRTARFTATKLNRLDFTYRVEAGDADDDGVSVGANALVLNGATVKAKADGTTDVDPAHGGYEGGLARKVDGSRERPTTVPTPTVAAIEFSGLAAGDSTYYRGEDVRVRVRFSHRVVVDVSGGAPYVDLAVGGETRTATFVEAAGARLDFAYTVQAGDADDDGVSVGANALVLKGATVKAAADSATDADPAHGRYDGGLARKVDGSRERPTQVPTPTVETIVFRGLADGDSTYYRGEVVRVRVRFNQHVVVDVSGGAPHVDLLVGSETRTARFTATKLNRLDFTYRVEAGDADDDGVSVGANALVLNGATVKAKADGTTDVDPAHGRYDGGLARKVDGSRERPVPTPTPTVAAIEFSGLAAGDSTYYRGEDVRVRVRFSHQVVVDVSGGAPYVDLAVGGERRTATFVEAAGARLEFAYTVQAGDADDDGVGVGSNALALNGATVKAAADSATDADPAHGRYDGGLARKVDGSRERPVPTPTPTVAAIEFSGLAAGDSTYYRGEDVRVRVRFSHRVVVDVSGGAPYVDLAVGGERRTATFVEAAGARLEFAYTVQAGDADDDGVGVGSNALTLNGATVKAAADSATDADPAHGRYEGGLARKVDGSRERPVPTPTPTVAAIEFSGLAAGDSTYYRGEDVRVRVRFSHRVVVDVSGGAPYVDLAVGGETRTATFVEAAGARLEFAYTVQAGDADDDGVSVGSNALALKGATVKAAADSATDADPAHGRYDGGLARKVDGSRERPVPTPTPTVAAIEFSGLAAGDSTYYRGEDVRVRVRFSHRVVVDVSGGAPYVDLAVGGETRTATFVEAAGARLEFAYTVQAGDADDDGVSVGANTLALKGATVKAAADSATDADPTHGRYEGGLARKVDGSRERPVPTPTPTVAAIEFSGLAAGDSTYYRGEDVQVRVRFSHQVVVDVSGGAPYVDLAVGGETRTATFVEAAGARLDFVYTVQAGDADDDGVSVGANALVLKGATVKAAADSATDADPAHGRYDGGLARKVDGSRERPTPTVAAIEFSGLATGDSTYYRGEVVQVRVRFNQQVVVDVSGGMPYVDLAVGGETRTATFVEAAGARLDFAYTVQAGDADDDGVSVSANALTLKGATVKAAADSTTDADPAHGRYDGGSARKVDGSRERTVPTPTVETIVFRGLADGDSTYYRGEVVRVRVRFNQHVVVNVSGGAPHVDLIVGSETRTARFTATKLNRLDFTYRVEAGDADDDGVSVGANALVLNGATVKAKADGTTDVDPAHGGYEGGLARKVDGSRERPTPTPAPTVAAIEFSGLAVGDSTYYRGEVVQVRVRFNQQVVVDVSGGTPYLDLAVGGETRTATFVEAAGARLDFAYAVQTGDADDDGVSVGANALALKGATVKAAADSATDADPAHGGYDGGLARKVDGSRERAVRTPTVAAIEFSGLAAGDSTYYRGEDVRVRVRFSHRVVVDVSGGTPYVDLIVGGETRTATFVEAAGARLDFAYTVQAGDADDDGVSVAANRLTLKGATVKAAADSATDADPAHGRYDGGLAHKVDGSKERPTQVPTPTVETIVFRGLTDGDSTYYRGEVVRVRVRFNRHVVVDVSGGAPYVDLIVGSETHRARFTATKLNRLDFTYRVEAGDADDDGVSVGANALVLNGATVKAKANGTTDVDPTHGQYEGGLARKVDGGRARPPMVANVRFQNSPTNGDTYGYGEQIATWVAFTDRVRVGTSGGTPSLALMVGAHVRHATLASPPGEHRRLRFSYTVQDGDRAPLGVSVAANTLVLNGATIKAAADSATDAWLAHPEVPADSTRKVDGAVFSGTAFGNKKPELVAPIAPKALVVGSEPAADALSAHFRDPDGDELGFSVVSAAQAVATAVVVDDVLTVRPRSPGQSLVTIRAADPHGAGIEHSFQVTVEVSHADQARITKQSLAAFGRTVGTEAVEAIGGRLRTGDREGANGQSHLRIGGRSLSCGTSSGRGCGLDGLARQAYRFLDVRFSPGLDGIASAFRGATRTGLDADVARGLAGAAGAPSMELGAQGMADAARLDGDSGWGRLLSINPLSSRDILSQTSFRFSPGGQQASPGGWTFWGQANTGGFEGRPDNDLALDGTVRSGFLGADYLFGDGPLVGLALSRTTSEIGFKSGVAGNGTVDVSLTGAYPYLRWSPHAGLNVWGLLGAGRGDAHMSDDAIGRQFHTDVGVLMTAVGARRVVGGGLAFNADAFAVRTSAGEFESSRSTPLPDGEAITPSHVYRLRLAPEIGGNWAASERSFIRSRLELGVRLDGGDAETGVGAEAGAEVAYAHQGIGLTVEARGRALVAHQADDFRDWGASVSVRLEPHRQDGGLSFMLRPTWGNDASSITAPWRDGAAGGALGRSLGRAESPSWAANRLEIETGYAVALSDIGQFAPFGRWTMSGASGRRMNVGLRLSVMNRAEKSAPELLAVDVFGQQATEEFGPEGTRFGVQGELRFR